MDTFRGGASLFLSTFNFPLELLNVWPIVEGELDQPMKPNTLRHRSASRTFAPIPHSRLVALFLRFNAAKKGLSK